MSVFAIGVVFSLSVATSVGVALFSLRAYYRAMYRIAELERRMVNTEAHSFETDAVAASLCCQVQDLENELAVVGAVVFDDTEEPPAASRPN